MLLNYTSIDKNNFSEIMRIIESHDVELGDTLKERIENSKHELNKFTSIVGHIISLNIISEEFDIPVKKIGIIRSNQEKPKVLNPQEAFFNISHSSDIVISGVSDSEIGIDVEMKQIVKPKVIEHVLCELEYKAIQKTDNISDLFIKVWTIKESFLKLLGLGLSVPLRDVVVDNIFSDGGTVSYGEFKAYYQTHEYDEFYITYCLFDKNKLTEPQFTNCSDLLRNFESKICSVEIEVNGSGNRSN